MMARSATTFQPGNTTRKPSIEAQSNWAFNILEAASRQDMSLRKLADKSGVARSTIDYMLTGRRAADINKVEWLALSLGYTLSQITLEPEDFDALGLQPLGLK